MDFDDLARMDAGTFLSVFGEGEPVTYYPRGDRTRGRQIRAVVDRTPPMPVIQGLPAPFVYKLSLTVANHPLRGIAGAEFDPGADTVDVAVVKGGPRVNLPFTAERQVSDAGMLKLWCA